jgi:murein DD-endopeptidase MepM/ murein hydrolase activator NlpD
VSSLRKIWLAAAVLAVAACQSPLGATTAPPQAPSASTSGATETGFVLPWDTSASKSHEIMCAYGGEGITAAGTAGATAGCGHHVSTPGNYTQDGNALDFDLQSGDAVRSVQAGIVRWAEAYTGSSSWSCYGNSIAIDTRLDDGTVVTAMYAHLSSIEVSVGDQVGAGKEIGKAGTSGGGTNKTSCPSAYGPHLHLAVYTDASYTDAQGGTVAASDLPATATPSGGPVKSPPYAGSARLPEPWRDCSRHSALTSPPSGEDSTCANLHAGDVLTYSAGQSTSAPAHGTFSSTGSMATARHSQTATLLKDGRVLMIGGYGLQGPDVLASAELYDPATGKFSPTGSTSVGRMGHSATLLQDGRVLVAGGEVYTTDNTSSVASAEIYDPATGRFSPTGSMSSRRSRHSATLLPDGRVLIAGGEDFGQNAYLSSAEIYDPATGKFSPTGSMGKVRGYQTATLLSGGRVLIAGGANNDGPLPSAELFDPAQGRFSSTGSLAVARLLHTATLLRDGRVLLAGGSDGAAELASAELYDPATGSFSQVGAMAVPRWAGAATLLQDGRVLVTGGSGPAANGGTAPVASAEIYDPATGKFSPTGSMTTVRYLHTATLLRDGRVLVAGGDSPDPTSTTPKADFQSDAIASAELYQP